MGRKKNRPMPKDSYPVRDWIRENVKQPGAKPKFLCGTDDKRLRWLRKKGYCCPLGLYRYSTAAPGNPVDMAYYITETTERHIANTDPFSMVAFTAFVHWWDAQTDPDFAVKEVWG